MFSAWIASIIQKILPSTICASIIYIYQQEIKNFINIVVDCVSSYVSSSLIIDKTTTHQTTYAILRELDETHVNKTKSLMVVDNGIKPIYKIKNGTYYINNGGTKYHISITNDKIEIFSYFTDMITMKRMLDKIYQKHNTTTNILTFYLSEEKCWANPIFRRPRQNMKLTAEMNKMIVDISLFYELQTEQEFAEQGKPYRRGYLVHGPPGTGKTSIVEKIATINDSPIYMINFNSANMSDTNLINLVANVPTGSIIVIDEMDKQYDSIKKNKNVHISTNGILTALDGPQRLSHGTLIIIIANDITTFDSGFYSSLVRPGRIDKIFNFTECL